MKKFMAMLLALVMALSLVACGQKADDTAKDDANTDNTDDSLVVLENVVDWGETEPYRVLVQKGDPKGLLEGINKAIAELTANDGALIKEIENKVASQDTYMPDAVSSDLTAETTDDTAASDKPVLVMGTSPDYPPYEFFADAAMTEYAGIDVEVAKYIAESMGMTLQIESMNFDNLVTSLSNGDFDVVLAAGAVSESNYARVQSGFEGDITLPSQSLNDKLRASAAKQGIPLIEGNIHSSDVFYRQPSDAKPTYWEKLRDERGCLCVEMESFALFANAQVLGKNAACLLTISDSFVSPEITTAEQRQKSFTDMMKVALGAEY